MVPQRIGWMDKDVVHTEGTDEGQLRLPIEVDKEGFKYSREARVQ